MNFQTFLFGAFTSCLCLWSVADGELLIHVTWPAMMPKDYGMSVLTVMGMKEWHVIRDSS